MKPIHLSFQMLWNGNHFSKVKKGHNSKNNWRILPYIVLDLQFMIIYLYIKFESNTLIFFKRYRTETIFQLFFNIDKGP